MSLKFDFKKSLANLPSKTAGTDKKAENAKEEKKPGVSLSFGNLTAGAKEATGTNKEEKKKMGLKFNTGKSEQSNPYGSKEQNKGLSFNSKGGAKGIEAYAPKDSDMYKLLNSNTGKEAPQSAASKITKNTPKTRTCMHKQYEIKEIEMSGVQFDCIFSMPKDGTGHMGQMFKRRLNLDIQ